MKWIHAVGWENVDCSICGESLDDLGGYLHDDLSNEQWDYIENRWGDPALFIICESCLGGHCGADDAYTPNSWFTHGPHTGNKPSKDNKVWQ